MELSHKRYEVCARARVSVCKVSSVKGGGGSVGEGVESFLGIWGRMFGLGMGPWA